jgi:CBS domain-containing protein
MTVFASDIAHAGSAKKLGRYPALEPTLLQTKIGFSEPSQNPVRHVDFEDPAQSVMTDLKLVNLVLINPEDSIVEANQRMIQRSVRLLLVVDGKRDVAGLITATDVLGEKPIQLIAIRRGRHDDIRVQDIMTPWHLLEVLQMEDVRGAKVGHVVSTLKKSGRQHALVVETTGDGQKTLRGLFSVTQIARQLGAAIHIGELARTFAEIERLLSH